MTDAERDLEMVKDAFQFCNGCSSNLPVSDFWTNTSQCKRCKAAKKAAYYTARPGLRAAIKLRSYLKHRETTRIARGKPLPSVGTVKAKQRHGSATAPTEAPQPVVPAPPSTDLPQP